MEPSKFILELFLNYFSMAFGTTIKELRTKRKVSVQKIADAIGVDADRWRKWEEKDLNPRDEDTKKIEAFFGMPLSQIEKLTNLNDFQFVQNGGGYSILEEPQAPYGKAQSADFLAGKLSGIDELLEEKELRRKEAEERAKRAEEQNDRLMALLESNLNMLHTEVRVGLAYQKAWVEYEAEKAAQGDEKKQQEVLDKMGRLVRSKIKVDPKTDNAASGRS